MDYEYHMPISRLFIVVNVAAGVGILTTCLLDNAYSEDACDICLGT
jgi:hypothetical protein